MKLLGQGNENAKIAIIGDYPTKESITNQLPIYGSEYNYYKKLLDCIYYLPTQSVNH